MLPLPELFFLAGLLLRSRRRAATQWGLCSPPLCASPAPNAAPHRRDWEPDPKVRPLAGAQRAWIRAQSSSIGQTPKENVSQALKSISHTPKPTGQSPKFMDQTPRSIGRTPKPVHWPDPKIYRPDPEDHEPHPKAHWPDPKSIGQTPKPTDQTPKSISRTPKTVHQSDPKTHGPKSKACPWARPQSPLTGPQSPWSRPQYPSARPQILQTAHTDSMGQAALCHHCPQPHPTEGSTHPKNHPTPSPQLHGIKIRAHLSPPHSPQWPHISPGQGLPVPPTQPMAVGMVQCCGTMGLSSSKLEVTQQPHPMQPPAAPGIGAYPPPPASPIPKITAPYRQSPAPH